MTRFLAFLLRAFGCAGMVLLAGCDGPIEPVQFEVICTCHRPRPRVPLTADTARADSIRFP